MSAVATAAASASSLTVPPYSLTVPPAPSQTVPPARRSAPSLAAAAKPWKDVPFPILFVLGALFGVVFAMTVVSLSKPRPVAAAFAPLPVTVETAKVQTEVPGQRVAAPSRIESAPFVAWAAPPAMPTVAAEPQIPSSTTASATTAHAAHRAKRGARGSRRASL